MFANAFIALTLAAAAIARPFTTAPVASTTYTGGQSAVVRWQDDGTAPSLEDFGPASISIYVGNAQQQTRLQVLNASVDVSEAGEITFTPDASIGPNSKEYFIRYESLELKDAAQPQFPALAFSAKFELTGMTGVFSADILSQIAGQSTAPLSPTSSGSSTTPRSTPATTSTGSPTSSKAVTSTSSTSATPTQSSGAAIANKAGWAGVLLSALVGMTMF